MLAVPDSRARAVRIAEQLGTSVDDVESFITELHTGGLWRNIDKLRDGGTDPKAKFYLSLAGICQERDEEFVPAGYLADRQRVLSELDVLGGEDRANAQQAFDANLQERVYALPDKEVVEVDGERIPIARGFPFIGMAAEGFEGGISKSGDDEDPNTLYFVGTENISEATLENTGMVPAYAELGDGTRVEPVSEEAKKGRLVFAEASELSQPLTERKGKLKRITGGYYLAYHNKDLAKKLLATELRGRRKNPTEGQ